MNFTERLRQLRNEQELSQKDLGKKLHLGTSAISMYERGEREPDFEKLETIADYFNVNIDYLLGKSDERNPSQKNVLYFENLYPIETKKFPMLGEIACGQPIYTNEDRESYVSASTEIRADFCLKAKGDSMINARIMDGDIVFIRQQPVVDNGDIAAVIIDDTATLKRVYYYPEEQKIVLSAENSRYAPIVYTGEELDHVHILGLAVAFQSDVK